jgi:hypothetical protein
MADRIPLGVMGNVHKSVDGSVYPLKITLPSNLTLHLSLSKITQQPALQSGRKPTSNANTKFGRMCPVRTVSKPGMAMLHMCVDFTLRPSGRLIINGLDATCLFATLMPSMTNMDVAPMSSICNVAIVMAFKASCEVGPNNTRAAMAHAHSLCVCTWMLLKEEQVDMITVVSLLHLPVARVKVVLVGSREVKVFLETKLLNLYAIFFSAPPHQAEGYCGSIILWIPFIHMSCPLSM